VEGWITVEPTTSVQSAVDSFLREARDPSQISSVLDGFKAAVTRTTPGGR